MKFNLFIYVFEHKCCEHNKTNITFNEIQKNIKDKVHKIIISSRFYEKTNEGFNQELSNLRCADDP